MMLQSKIRYAHGNCVVVVYQLYTIGGPVVHRWPRGRCRDWPAIRAASYYSIDRNTCRNRPDVMEICICHCTVCTAIDKRCEQGLFRLSACLVYIDADVGALEGSDACKHI